MSPDKILKAALVTLGGICAAITANDFFSVAHRAFAGVLGAGSGALLAYVLNPQISTKEVEPEEEAK